MRENVMFGRESNRFYVNSAQGISRSRVDGIFPKSNADGSVQLRDILEEIKREDGSIQIDGILIGSVAIRRRIESLGLAIKGSPYSKKQANNLIKNTDFIRELPRGDNNSIKYCGGPTLSAYIEKAHRHGQNTHRTSLKKARKMKKLRLK